MSQFLYLYRRGQGTMTGSPEQMQKQMQKWVAWLTELGDKVKDPGQPLEETGKVVKARQGAVTDGPYAEKDIVSGYSFIEAKDIAHAVEMSRGCPILEAGGAVEVRPVLKMDM
jgi:hypothetical protein